MFVITNNAGMIINADVKSWLMNSYAIKDLFGILVIVSANFINHVILVSVYTIKIESSKKISK